VGVYDIDRILVPQAPPEYRDDTADAHFVPAPCQVACPVGTDAPSYLAYIWEGKYQEAFEAITSTNPFSSICGRVCDAPCEPACRREAADGAVQIRNLKRFVMDRVGHDYDPPAIAVTKSQSIGIVGAGPAGLTAAHDLCAAGYRVDVYEMTDRPGGMMVWGIPAFRLPPGIIEEDIQRLEQRCPGLSMHFSTALGRDVSLADLKNRHDAVLLTIGAWWGKAMGIPGEQDERVVDGVGFLRRVNAGERPELPETVVVIGGGDVAMDACRVARRLPGCKHVQIVYRRGPEDIPARPIELEGAIEEGIEIVYNTQQVSVRMSGNQLVLRCVRTEAGEADEDGRRRPVVVPGSEHDIACGMVIAAIGQQSECQELAERGLMAPDRVRANFDGMRTDDDKVFAAGDGAFGGSTIVMAMSHGQRAAYYIKAYLEGRESPMPYRTPYRTRRVPVAQDLMWEKWPEQEVEFFGLGDKPVEFPEIEATYDEQSAQREAARCYRCDAETGSADYSVHHREDLFSMARTNVVDHSKHRAMLDRRLRLRENPFPPDRPPSLDDLVFLPANLSRLVIDPYREACKISTDLAGKLELTVPYIATGFDSAPEEVRRAVAGGLVELGCSYMGRRSIDSAVPWLQLMVAGESEPSAHAAGVLHVQKSEFRPPSSGRLHDDQLLGMAVSSTALLEQCIVHGLEQGFDMILLDATAGIETPWPELRGTPDPRILRDAITILRRLDREEEIDLVYFGGVRSGTDSAKLIALGVKAVVLGVTLGLSVGGSISDQACIEFASDWSEEERSRAIVSIVNANAGEASMMARCTGKTKLHNLEPEDLRSVTLATAEATGVPLAGMRLT
jgi:NADPH-dependent glutamate synthase beta subunit-like oxidoreductase